MGSNGLRGKWRNMGLLSAAELLVMCTWFSASAVVPALAQAWNLGDGGRAWLTMSVQVGFVGGSLISALLNLADRIPARILFPISAFLAAVFTGLIPILPAGLTGAVVLRMMTGVALSGV
ncbi:MAG: MFS transporter, partial [Anaerolineaceae bacterium]|nr:MFS transporter [Anaerolineaceae bacterium]